MIYEITNCFRTTPTNGRTRLSNSDQTELAQKVNRLYQGELGTLISSNSDKIEGLAYEYNSVGEPVLRVTYKNGFVQYFNRELDPRQKEIIQEILGFRSHPTKQTFIPTTFLKRPVPGAPVIQHESPAIEEENDEEIDAPQEERSGVRFNPLQEENNHLRAELFDRDAELQALEAQLEEEPAQRIFEAANRDIEQLEAVIQLYRHQNQELQRQIDELNQRAHVSDDDSESDEEYFDAEEAPPQAGIEIEVIDEEEEEVPPHVAAPEHPAPQAAPLLIGAPPGIEIEEIDEEEEEPHVAAPEHPAPQAVPLPIVVPPALGIEIEEEEIAPLPIVAPHEEELEQLREAHIALQGEFNQARAQFDADRNEAVRRGYQARDQEIAALQARLQQNQAEQDRALNRIREFQDARAQFIAARDQQAADLQARHQEELDRALGRIRELDEARNQVADLQQNQEALERIRQLEEGQQLVLRQRSIHTQLADEARERVVDNLKNRIDRMNQQLEQLQKEREELREQANRRPRPVQNANVAPPMRIESRDFCGIAELEHKMSPAI